MFDYGSIDIYYRINRYNEGTEADDEEALRELRAEIREVIRKRQYSNLRLDVDFNG